MKRYTDKQRLDFLLFNNPKRVHYLRTGLLQRYYDEYCDTPRQAIDEIIRESEKGKNIEPRGGGLK